MAKKLDAFRFANDVQDTADILFAIGGAVGNARVNDLSIVVWASRIRWLAPKVLSNMRRPRD
jgi:hypothetical protein